MALARSLAGSLVKPLASAITGASGGAVDPYAANGFSPDYVADFSATSADFFRVAGVDSDFETAFTSDSEGGGLATQVNSSGNLVWRAHNAIAYSQEGFENWSLVNATVTQDADSYSGVSADKLVEDGTTDFHRMQIADALSGTVRRKLYAVIKSDGDSRYVQFGGYGLGGAGESPVFNPDAGTVDTAGSTVLNSASITLLGDGFYLCEADVSPSSDTDFIVSLADDAADNTTQSYAGDGASGVIVLAAWVTRADLGGMADNPDPVATGLESYVPTTTAARYLARRRHHRWDGSAWVPTCLHEPVGPVANSCLDSRDLTTANWATVNTGSVSRNATGIDGEASTACTVTDSDGSANYGVYQDVTVADDSSTHAVSFFVEYDASPSVYPRVGFALIGGTQLRYWIVFDRSDGTYVTTDNTPTDVFVERWSADYWRVTVVGANNGTGNTTFRAQVSPAWNTDGSATNDNTATGSVVVDQLDMVVNASLPSSPIPTNGSTVTRTADTLKGKAASLPYSSTAMSMAFAGRLNGADSGTNQRYLDWYQDSNDRLILFNASGVNRIFAQEGGTFNSQTATTGSVSGVIQESLKIAGRIVAGAALQSAFNGSAGAEVTGSVPNMPPLSDNNLRVSIDGVGTTASGINGTVDTIRLWSDDIAEAGLEESTA